MSLEGTVLDGRYRLERRLGAGGMATVWLAKDERLGRQVAIKVLSDVLATDPGYRARFEREARIAAGLSHPYLVNVYDYGVADERPYLVMEYVAGPTLADKPHAGARVDPATLTAELLSALGRIHGAGVIHRDVKPANVLIGPDGRARLTDFGIARAADATQLTETGKVIGTLDYMAPEVRAGEPATERSDLYSLGALVRQVARGRPTPPALESLLTRLLDPDPARRPESASQALAMLEGSAEGTPTEFLPPPTAPLPAPTATRTPRRGLALLLAALAAAAAVAVALVLALDGGGGSPNGTDAAKRTGSTAKPQARTVTETTTQTSTAAAPPADTTTTTPAPAETPAETSTKPNCAQLEAQREALDEQKKAAEERLKDDPTAKKAAHERFEEQKHALDEQLKACK